MLKILIVVLSRRLGIHLGGYFVAKAVNSESQKRKLLLLSVESRAVYCGVMERAACARS